MATLSCTSSGCCLLNEGRVHGAMATADRASVRADGDLVAGGVPSERRGDIAARTSVCLVCVGVPHPLMGEELVGMVVAVDAARPPDPNDLVVFCRDRLAHFKCPRRIEIVGDVGRTAMGKIDKRALAARYA